MPAQPTTREHFPKEAADFRHSRPKVPGPPAIQSPLRQRLLNRSVALLLWVAAFAGPPCSLTLAHDIPNERIDRSIQVTLSPGRIAIDYEVSLTELTLTQDLRRLIGSLPGAERQEWLARYGQETGPLNAKGILVTVEGERILLSMTNFDLVVEEHPRYAFHLSGRIPARGRLRVQDTNYVSSEGTSRLAIRGQPGVVVEGDRLPAEVAQIAIRQVWALTDEEERRTKQVVVNYRAADVTVSTLATGPSTSELAVGSATKPPATEQTRTRVSQSRLYGLLDETSKASWLMLALVAVLLGAAHAIQPGHGKTLVTAVALGPGVQFYQPALLGLATTLAHVGSVLLIAAVLWFTGASAVGTAHVALTRAAGFVIGAAGLWRVGRSLGGYFEHDDEALTPASICNRNLIGLGLAGGVVPCWDAVALLLLAAALGRLAAGVALVLAFSTGMAVVLVVVGIVAMKLKRATFGIEPKGRSRRLLSIAGGAVLAAIGFSLYFTA
jgi:ABC-type nickel/cobalt efflux system permease component RcnA